MLAELDIRNLAIAEHVRVRFSSGLTVITGETGAGKSLIVDALSFLLGSRADADLIRTGESSARVEGIFDISSRSELRPLLDDLGLDAAEDQLIISREMRREGRGLVRLNGRALAQSQLLEVGQALVDIHGQGDYMSLLRPQEQLSFLDRFAGSTPLKQEFAQLAARLRAARRELAEITEGERERARRSDQLRFEVAEIERAEIIPGQEDELIQERDLLGNSEQLAVLAQEAVEALEAGEPSGIDAVGGAAAALAGLARLDTRMAERAERAAALQDELADLVRDLRAYREEVEFNPQRLEAVEGRLALLANLKRKYGATLDEVLAYGAHSSEELDRLEGGDERAAALREEEVALLQQLKDSGLRLSATRRAAAARLAEEVEVGLRELSMEGARFAIRLSRQQTSEGVAAELPLSEVLGSVESESHETVSSVGFDRDGLEKVEFLVSMNPGEELRPLARVASGGETSRLMLVLKSILGAADATPTLVFDEVDAGIGGRAALVVGRSLRDLAGHHQVVCISHLPQIAAYSHSHLSVSKVVAEGRTAAVVSELSADERVVEMAQMIGGPSDASVAAARELLAAAAPGGKGNE
ncbi:MAG: DNA repair protein RecN [Dehalococcoidia bacterium]